MSPQRGDLQKYRLLFLWVWALTGDAILVLGGSINTKNACSSKHANELCKLFCGKRPGVAIFMGVIAAQGRFPLLLKPRGEAIFFEAGDTLIVGVRGEVVFADGVGFVLGEGGSVLLENALVFGVGG